MGGKGGGDGEGQARADYFRATMQEDPSDPSGFMRNADRTYVTKAEYAERKRAEDAAKAAADKAAADAKKPKEEAPVAAAPDPLANMPAAPATDTTVAPPASMAAGDTLGGAVITPPRYWVGGLDQYESANRTGRGGSGAMKTTQT